MRPATAAAGAGLSAGGQTTSETARSFGLTAARISQPRRWLRVHWLEFQGELPVQRLRLGAAGANKGKRRSE